MRRFRLTGTAGAPAPAGTIKASTPAKVAKAITLPVQNWLRASQVCVLHAALWGWCRRRAVVCRAALRAWRAAMVTGAGSQRFDVAWGASPPGASFKGPASFDVPPMVSRDYKLSFYSCVPVWHLMWW